MDFFKLAYLIEIAIVINLAFRELKFHQLSEKVREEIKRITYESSSTEATNGPHFLMLKSLIDCQAETKIKESNDIRPMWYGRNFIGAFFKIFIRSQRALRITNVTIVSCIILLILITSFYSWPPALEVVMLSNIIRIWEHEIFIFLAMILSVMCLLPLVFIYLTTKCEIYLFGSAIEETPGQIKSLELKLEEYTKDRRESMESYNKGSENNHKPDEKAPT